MKSNFKCNQIYNIETTHIYSVNQSYDIIKVYYITFSYQKLVEISNGTARTE